MCCVRKDDNADSGLKQNVSAECGEHNLHIRRVCYVLTVATENAINITGERQQRYGKARGHPVCYQNYVSMKRLVFVSQSDIAA